MKRWHPIYRFAFIAFMVFVLLGTVGAGFAIGGLIGIIHTLPPLDALKNYNPPEISRVYDKSGSKQIDELTFEERRELVSIKDIPEHVRNAFLAIEDERFHEHFGVDFWGIGRAFVTNIRSGGAVQGASTITMQVARNMVLLDRQRRLERKIREVFVSFQIERNYSKDQILEFYLNHIFLGARAYGIQAASRAYFNKDVKDLSVPEAAMLAGLPKGPSLYSPFRDAERARNRRNLVLGKMRELGHIKSEEDVQRYMGMPIELNPAPRIKSEAPYFTSYVRSLLLREMDAENNADLAHKAFTIVTTVDLELQQILEEELSKALIPLERTIESQKESRLGAERSLGSVKKDQARLARISSLDERSAKVTVGGYTGEIALPEKLPYFEPEKVLRKGRLIDIYIHDLDPRTRTMKASLYDKSHVQGAAVLLDVKSGEILAIAGGNDFYDEANDGQYNRAVQGGRQPGSCWKPLLYAAALDLKRTDGTYAFTPATVIQDEVYTIGNYTPKNFGGRYYGPTALYEALVFSRNVPTVKLFMEIGASKATNLYHLFNMPKNSEWKLDAVPSMALGTPNITPLELASAYAIFANGGVGIKPMPVKRRVSVKSPGDTRISRPETLQVISPQAAYMTTRILQDAVSRGTAKGTVGTWVMQQTAKGRKVPEVAGKTGTTNDSFDAWFCGYTPELVLCIKVGYDQHRSMGTDIVGGRTVGPIWVAMMDRILQTRSDWKLKFDVPPNIVMRDLCSKSGKLASSDCFAYNAVYKNAAFRTGTEPKSSCAYHSAYYGYGGETEDAEGSYYTPRQAGPPQYGPQYQQQEDRRNMRNPFSSWGYY